MISNLIIYIRAMLNFMPMEGRSSTLSIGKALEKEAQYGIVNLL
jgi:hypothetical protein